MLVDPEKNPPLDDLLEFIAAGLKCWCICPNPLETGNLAKIGLVVLHDLPQVRLVENQDFTFSPGIEITEIAQVKGLEFDYVILVDVSDENYSDAPADRRRLHVGATRAVHQLWLTSVGTPSSLVRSVPQHV